ncbi:branched-chain amino acid ABC transporter substrate-binding protein, partial [Escherichia coli]
MQTKRQTALSISLVFAAVLGAVPMRAQQAQAAPEAAGSEIRIGNVMPYTGPLAAFAT